MTISKFHSKKEKKKKKKQIHEEIQFVNTDYDENIIYIQWKLDQVEEQAFLEDIFTSTGMVTSR